MFRGTAVRSPSSASRRPRWRGLPTVLASSSATEDAGIITFAVLAIAFTVLSVPTSGHGLARAAHLWNGRRRPAE